MPLRNDEQEAIFKRIMMVRMGPVDPEGDELVKALIRIRDDWDPDYALKKIEEAEYRGYRRALKEVAADIMKKLGEKFLP